jgi:hypothetical protein
MEDLATEESRKELLRMHTDGETGIMSAIGASGAKGFDEYKKHRGHIMKMIRGLDEPQVKQVTIWERLKKRKG